MHYEFNLPMRFASKVVPNPKNAISVNEIRRLAACAIKPINGGPNKKPRKPIEETNVNAIPGAMIFDLPARL